MKLSYEIISLQFIVAQDFDHGVRLVRLKQSMSHVAYDVISVKYNQQALHDEVKQW